MRKAQGAVHGPADATCHSYGRGCDGSGDCSAAVPAPALSLERDPVEASRALGAEYPVCDVPTAYRFHVLELLGEGVSFEVAATAQYIFRVVHCDAAPVSFAIHAAFRNLDLTLLAVFGAHCLRFRAHVRNLHLLGAAILLASAAEAFANQQRFAYASSYGVTDRWLSLAQKLFRNFTLFLTLAAMLLLSLGWSYVRDTLPFRETRVIGVCMTIYGALAALEASCVVEDGACRNFGLAEYIARAFLELVIIVAINFHMSNLRSQLCGRVWSATTIRTYLHLQQLYGLRRAFFVYILAPTGIYIIEVALLRWELRWVRLTLEYLLYLFIVAYVGTIFRARDVGRYVAVLEGLGRSSRHHGLSDTDDAAPGERESQRLRVASAMYRRRFWGTWRS